jgi:hypothetical protein
MTAKAAAACCTTAAPHTVAAHACWLKAPW